MRLFLELARRAFERQLAYRAAAFAGLATNFFFGLLRAAVMVALYQGRQEIAGFSMIQAVTFTGLSQAIIGSMSFFGWYDLMNNVYSGGVASDLLKPMNLFSYWLAQDAGRALALLFLRGVPIMAAYGILLGAVFPSPSYRFAPFSLG
jgi:ABC-2 type transport system permease protein